jgi:hypothetical protein
MMAIANDEPAPKWRNFAVWSGVGAVFYLVVLWGVSAYLHEDALAAMTRSKAVVAMLGLAMIVAMAAVGFSGRNRPIGLKALRNFVIRDTIAVIVFLIGVWGFSRVAATGALGATGGSAWIAAAVGSTLIVLGLLGLLALASAHRGGAILDDAEAADDMRERGRLMLCSFAWMAACGLLLIVLGMSGPGGLLSPAAALAGALALIAVLAMLGIATWRLADELVRTLSYETGNMAFQLILAIGGGWAMLAHLGFVAAPASLGWLTLFILLLFAATFIALGRRRLLAG